MSGTEQSESDITPILIVEDETVFAKAVQKRLKRDGLGSWLAGDISTARSYLKDHAAQLIILDLRLPDGSGLEFLSRLREEKITDASIIVMSAYGEIEDAVTAMKQGASDYVKKPVNLEELILTVKRVLDHRDLEVRLAYSHKREKHEQSGAGSSLLGESGAIAVLRKEIVRIAALVSGKTELPTVLILGETGTGKDLVARLLHSESLHASRPYVHVDCTALPTNLIESELFGHERGAFTDAHITRAGLVEAAEDGVLFLDEIGELPIDLQGKLLSVLERRKIRRVGTSDERPVRAWFIAATNRNLEKMVREGDFRADLFYRLNVLQLVVPPLRQRSQDALLLARYFVTQTTRRYQLDERVISEAAEQKVMTYHWPGNVRELKHVVERAVLLSTTREISAALFPSQAAAGSEVIHSMPPTGGLSNCDKLPGSSLPEHTLNETEKQLIQQALDKADGNVSRAARTLGITRMTMRYRMKKHEIDTNVDISGYRDQH